MAIKRSIEYGPVDLTRPHLLLSFFEDYGVAASRPVAVLSPAQAVEDMRLSLLFHDIESEYIIGLIQNKLTCILYKHNHPDPLLYILCYCDSFMNLVYSNIRLSKVKNIHKNNILYYIKTKSKLVGIPPAAASEMQDRYIEVVVNSLFENVLNSGNHQDFEIYNQDLYHFQSLIFNDLPSKDGFEIEEPLSIIEFAKLLSTVEINDFCYILLYLKKIKLLGRNDHDRFLSMYHLNYMHHQKSSATS